MKFDKKFWTEGHGSFFLAVGFAFAIRWAVMEAYVIPSGSMLPSLLIHDHIFVNKMVYGLRFPFTEKWIYINRDPKRGEVIVFRFPENPDTFFIKRVIGVPGDKIFYDNARLYINDKVVEQSVPQELKSDFDWLRDEDLQNGTGSKDLYVHWVEQIDEHKFSTILLKGTHHNTAGPFEVPADSFFVMGDNRDNSMDGRVWKTTHFVPRKYLIGKAMFVWLSCEDTLPVISFLCNPVTIRWTRFFHGVN